MANFLGNHRIGALITILVLAIGSISSVVTTQVVRGSDGSLLSNILGGCIYDACKDTKITGNFTNGTTVGCVFGACKNKEITGLGQPSPNTGTLIVTKIVECHNDPSCNFQASDFNIKITGINPSPDSFPGSKDGTQVTLGAGQYIVTESGPTGFITSFSGNCVQASEGIPSALGNINAGETQECIITNDFRI